MSRYDNPHLKGEETEALRGCMKPVGPGSMCSHPSLDGPNVRLE